MYLHIEFNIENRRMKQFLAIIFITVLMFFSSCCSKTVEPNTHEELKVLAWNIWHGGHQKLLPTNGCKGVLGILKQSDADVILMVETYGSSATVADELGYYHRLLSSNLSVYSKYPIVNTYTFPDSISTFNFGGVEIDVNGTRVRVFDVWLNSGPDARLVPTDKSEQEILAWENAGSRDDEIRKILSVLTPFLAEVNEIPIIMGGDFNIHSHLDWTEETKDMYNHGGAVVNWTVSKNMEKAGFKDSFREINPDVVENLGTTWIHPNIEEWEFKFSGAERTGKNVPYDPEQLRYDRIDYIYYKGDKLKATESETYCKDLGEYLTFKGKEFFFGSDHGFVFTTFEVEK